MTDARSTDSGGRHRRGHRELVALVATAGVAAIAAAACGGSAPRLVSTAGDPGRVLARTGLPRTRAERSQYTETSGYADVVSFLDSLQRAVPLVVGSIGSTAEGRPIAYVVASRPVVATPSEARRLGRPVVYVQANIHAGEVEGKEALLALVRDLVAAPGPSVLDSVVLVAVPLYNADGNEREAPQKRNRTEQQGPELVGQRANAQGLDLNRDYVKAEAPETRASLAMFTAWDPEVFVDLHTTDGSFHGYALTYAASLNPAASVGAAFERDSLLPELRRRMRTRHGLETFDYGNFDSVYEEKDVTDTVKRGWYTYDHRPRFGTNYYGLRGRLAVLSEAYAHDPFERRVRSTYLFVRELLSLVAERGPRVLALAAAADRQAAVGSGMVALRARLTTRPRPDGVVAEDLVRSADTALAEPGIPGGVRRTGHFRTVRIPVYDRFEPTLAHSLPSAWAFGPHRADIARLLRAHGVRVERTRAAWRARGEEFVVDSVVVAAEPFQGHRTVRLEGHWGVATRSFPADAFVVPAQPLGVLAAYLLEPESDDGLTAWNFFDRELTPGAAFPVLRVTGPLDVARRTDP